MERSGTGQLGDTNLDVSGKLDIVCAPASLEDATIEFTVQERARRCMTKELVEATRSASSKAKQSCNLTLRALTASIVSLINVLDPEIILLGGGIADAENMLLETLEIYFAKMEWRTNGMGRSGRRYKRRRKVRGKTMNKMTSRERVLNAIQHLPVDRTPIDLGGTRQSGIAVEAYARLRKRLGIDTGRPPRVFDVFQMLAEIEPEIMARFHSDCVSLERPAVAFGIENDNWKRYTLPNGMEVETPGGFNPEREPDGSLVLKRDGEEIGRMPANGFYFDRLEKYPGALHPDLNAWEVPLIPARTFDYYARRAKELHDGTDKAVICAMGPPYELFMGIGQGGFEDWMVTFASEPEYVERLYHKLTDAWIENLQSLHAAAGDRIHILQIADDFGAQRAPFLSVKMFRKLLLPAYKRGLDWIHENTVWKVMLHSDGAIFSLLPSIVEMGVDIINPVQTTAAGMDPRLLKDEFGAQLVFWGGSCDSQHTLAFSTPEVVVKETRSNLEILAPGGGFVFASVHNIQANVPADNIIALFDTAIEFH